MDWLFLAVALWGAFFTLNAFWPVRRNRLLFGPSFFASWMTIELAAHHLVWQALATVVFIALGALGGWAGWLGLAITLASWVGLGVLIVRNRRAEATATAELAAVVPEGEDRPRVPSHHVAFPFLLKRPRETTVDKHLEFARVGGRKLHLDVYRPKEPGSGRPAILQIHGGGWTIGDKREQGIPLLSHLAANGWVGFNVNYRLSPAATFPDHLVDIKRALAWIRERADEFGIDPDFVAVTGGSAGGHLTALMGLTANDPVYQPGFEEADTSVQAAVPFYGIYDFTDRNGVQHPDFLATFIEPWVMKAFIADEPEKFTAASPIDRVRADAPPFLVLHGDQDTLAPVEDARTFVADLRAASSQPVIYVELAGAQHAFDLFVSMRARPVIEAVERFLDATRTAHGEVGVIPEADVVVDVAHDVTPRLPDETETFAV